VSDQNDHEDHYADNQLVHFIADYVYALCEQMLQNSTFISTDTNHSDCRMKILVREWDKVQANIVCWLSPAILQEQRH
jgi:hypothetical protein